MLGQGMMDAVKLKTSNDCEFCNEISKMSEKSTPPQLTERGKIVLFACGATFTGISALLIPFVFPGFRKFPLPFLPATNHQVRNVMKALEGRTGTLIDIGSGDGRITLTTARYGFQSFGVEINLWLVLYSRFKAWRLGLNKQAQFFKKDLWKTNLSTYQNVVIFGVESMMPSLEKKLHTEMLPDTHIVACRFPLPSWQPVLQLGEGIDSVWLYKVPGKKNLNERSSVKDSRYKRDN